MPQANIKYAAWPTAWGPMGAVMGDQGLLRVVLPHYAMDDLRALLAFEHKQGREDREAFTQLIELTRQYFNGQKPDFSGVLCDLPDEKSFSGRIYRACRTIEYGQTHSYTWLAHMADNPDGARAAANAMGKNPMPLVVPCHRVIYAGGRVGGFSAEGGVELKRRMLRLEGVRAT
jgi:methylated-DNA-[protein]-cysteine S-methyltransferase